MKKILVLTALLLSNLAISQTQFYLMMNPDPNPTTMNSIFCWDQDDCHAVGFYGHYLHWDGSYWTLRSTNFSIDIYKITFVSPMIGYYCGENKGIAKTIDGGETWEVQNGVLGNIILQDIAFWDENNGIAVGGYNTPIILITDNGGQTWQECELADSIHKLYSVTYADETTIVAGGTYGRIILSTDRGASWELVNESTIATTNKAIRMVNSNVGYIAVANSTTLLKTLDGGQTWFEIPAPHLDGAKGIEVVSAIELYAFYDNIIYLSTDGGQTWNNFSTGIQTNLKAIYPLANNICYTVGSFGNLYYAIQMPLANDQIVLPEELSLTNYPNPFNPTTTISYSLPQASYISLVIYDLQGHALTELINSWQTPGAYHIQWSADHYTNGYYLARLITDKKVVVKKMILLK
jgi:photosystem II stability/assembly factor-like uncharacterized protein